MTADTAPFTEITGLNDPEQSPADSARPNISVMYRGDDVVVIRLVFRAG